MLNLSSRGRFFKNATFKQMSQLVLSTETCSFGPVFSTNWLICLTIAFLKNLPRGWRIGTTCGDFSVVIQLILAYLGL